jgi:hypothetical protein
LGGDIEKLPAGSGGCDAFGIAPDPPRFGAQALGAR